MADGPFSVIEAVRVILADTRLTLNHKMVLLVLARHADAGGHCFPSQPTIAREASLSERAARAALASLERSGLLTRQRTGNGVTHYYIDLAGRPDAQAAPGATRNDVPPGTTCHPAQDATQVAPPATQVAPRAGEVSQLTSQVTAQREKRPTGAPKPSTTRQEYPPEFEAFWAAYPRHEAKVKAYRVWQARIKEGVPPAALVDAAAEYARRKRKSATLPQFLLLPATFLGPDRPYEEYIQPRAAPGPMGETRAGKYDHLIIG